MNLDRGSLKIGFSSWPRIDDLDRPRLLSHGRADRRVSAVCGKCAGTCGTMGVLGDFSARIEARKYLKGAMVSDELASPSIANSNLWLQRWTPSTSDWKGGLIRQT